MIRKDLKRIAARPAAPTSPSGVPYHDKIAGEGCETHSGDDNYTHSMDEQAVVKPVIGEDDNYTHSMDEQAVVKPVKKEAYKPPVL